MLVTNRLAIWTYRSALARRRLLQHREINIKRTMKIAVEGCCHGELDAIYQHINDLEQKNQYKVDLLLMCGDFQAIRTHADLNCMAVPQKYLKLGGFHQYYTGQKVAPILTVVIGGNHEASNYLRELYHGGWLAPNIYYLGAAGVVQFNGLRIAGASGIYKSHDYRLGLYEKIPYDRSSVRSIYHVRQYDVAKLLK
ncbi:lariat debranching enzyme, partial [Tulasnella sp. 418]